MTNIYLIQYLVAFFEATIPVNSHSYYENELVTRARYESIAETIAEVSVEYPLFAGDVTGVKTGLLLGSIATFEGALRADIDTCKRGGDIDKSGVTHAWTLWQLHANKEKVCADRLAGARMAREMIRSSFKNCSKLEVPDRLGEYTDGVCHPNWNRSRHRMNRAIEWERKHPYEKSRSVLEDAQLPNDCDVACGIDHVRSRDLGVCHIVPTCDCSNR